MNVPRSRAALGVVAELATADAIRERFTALGLVAGVPAGCMPAAHAIDQAIVARMRCPSCHRRSMTCLPFTSERGDYRILAACGRCPAGEEM